MYCVVFIITATLVLKECFEINGSCFGYHPIKFITECGLLRSFVSYSSPDAPLQGVQVLLGDILSSLHGRSPPPCLK